MTGPNESNPSSAASMLRLRGYATKERDLATASLSRPHQRIHPIVWNPRVLSDEQIEALGGNPATVGSPEQPKAATNVAVGGRSGGGGKAAGGGVLASGGKFSRQSSASRRARGEAGGVFGHADLAGSRRIHPLEDALFGLREQRRRRLERLEAMGVLDHEANQARVDAEFAAALRKMTATFLGKEQRKASRARLGSGVSTGSAGTAGGGGSSGAAPPPNAALTSSASLPSMAREGPRLAGLLKSSLGAAVAGRRLSTGTLGAQLAVMRALPHDGATSEGGARTGRAQEAAGGAAAAVLMRKSRSAAGGLLMARA